jgi:hypothetical protein
MEFPSARSWAAPVRATSTIQNHTCWVTLLQPAGRAPCWTSPLAVGLIDSTSYFRHSLNFFFLSSSVKFALAYYSIIISLSLCLSAPLLVCLSAYVFVCLSVCISVCLSLCLSICLFNVFLPPVECLSSV